MNKRAVGTHMEEQACEYLSSHGFHILERNFRCKVGEIDIVGEHLGYLVFVEVKYRTGKRFGHAIEAVDGRKQKRICRVSDFYRLIHHLGMKTQVRYDVLAMQEDDYQWIQNAFDYR